MVVKRYSDLLKYTGSAYGVPASFLQQDPADDNSCIFLVSCLARDRILFMGNSCQKLTGYPPENFIKQGMDFWFPLIHPEDLPLVTEKIIHSHQELFKPGFTKEKLGPLVLEYRFRRPEGIWSKIRDTKWLLFPGDEVAVDKLLCKFELIPEDEINETGAEEILRKQKTCTKMLEFALVHNKTKAKPTLNEKAGEANRIIPYITSPLTKREKEILLLIAEGLSTKMIAAKCKISVNTVETHRRHLLKKLEVKNSMELIKQASKVFWL